MKIIVAFGQVFLFLIIWVYTYGLVVKVQRLFLDTFPKDAVNYLGSGSFFGINTKRGFLFLWDDKFICFSKTNTSIEKFRKRATHCILILIALIFLMPLSWVLIIISD
jgi:hypothetical protein